MSDRLKDIPELAPDASNIRTVIQAIREVLQIFRGYRGDPLDAAITKRSAVRIGILDTGGNPVPGPPGPPGASAEEPDPTPPPTAEGLVVTAGLSQLYIECSTPVYTQGHGHYVTVVYGAKWPYSEEDAPTFGDAVELMQFQGTYSVYACDPSTRWCIWIKWKSMDGFLSTAPAGGTNGVQAETGEDVSSLILAMTGSGNPFKVITEETTLPDGTIVPPGTYTADAFIHNGQITNAKIANLAVDDAKISTLSAQKITSGELDVATEIGVGGRLKLSGEGWIESYALANYDRNGDYTRLDQGQLRLYRYIPSLASTILYNFLSRVETGIANNNDVIVIPGYFAREPKISVFPASIGSYSAAYSSQNQTLVCQAAEISETATGSMRYQFRALANLAIAAGSGTAAVNNSSGDLTATTTWSSGNQNTPANCTSVTPTVSLTSMRWLASGTNYQRRQVNWRVRYTGDGGGGAWRTKDIGATITAVTDSYTFTFPSAGSYTFWIEFAASDAVGTFVATGANFESSNVSLVSTGSSNGPGWTRRDMPAYSAPAGWVVSSVAWSYQGQYYNSAGTGAIVFPDFTAYGASNPWIYTGTRTFTRSSYDQNALYAYLSGSSSSYGFGFTAGSAVVTISRYQGYTASGQNRFEHTSYNYTLSSNSILATGTLNWMAIGE